MKLLKKIKNNKRPINTVAWAPNGEIIASGGAESAIRLWNREGESIKVIEIPDFETQCVIWTEGILASSGEKIIRLWDTQGQSIREIDSRTNIVNHLAFAPDGKALAGNSIEFKVNIWDVTGSHIKELVGHTAEITGFGWSPDGKLFVTASEDAKIRLWNPSTWTELKVLSEHYESYTCMAWAPDGQHFVVGSWTYPKKFLRIYDREGKSTQVLEGHQDKILSVDWSKDGQLLVSGSTDKTVLIWNPKGTLLEKLKIGEAVTGVAISPDNKLLAVSSWDKNIHLYDLTDLKK
jgi:WD40 repeat protein